MNNFKVVWYGSNEVTEELVVTFAPAFGVVSTFKLLTKVLLVRIAKVWRQANGSLHTCSPSVGS